MSAISVLGLRKSYGALEALRGIDFDVAVGEVFGLLGPNGAGKTTTVEILEGYRKRDGGDVQVLGFDPGRAETAFRERIGVVLQSSELWANLTVREVHWTFAGYYRRPRDVDEVVRLVGLEEKRDERVKSLSGGQKRRLDLGKTVLLTTHYLDEAQQLADRVAVLRAGELVTIGRPAELIGAATAEIRYRREGELVVVETDEPTRALHELTGAALAEGRVLEDLEVRRPTLEDVYLELLDDGGHDSA